MEPDTENNAIARAKADLADIDRRIAVTKAEEDRLASERQRMEADRGKVESFIEMFERYAVAVGPSGAGSADSNAGAGRREEPALVKNVPGRHSRKRGPAVHRKPPNTPTTHDMILAALHDAESRGLPGLAPKDIGAFIKQKWWPHLKGSSVGPAAWRMYQDKEIRKEGGLYAPLAS